MSTRVWLPAQEAADLLGISRQMLHKRRRAGEFEAREAQGRGGVRFELALDSLPAAAQAAWSEANAPQIDVAASDPEPKVATISEQEIDMLVYQRAPEWARSKADKYLNIIKRSEGLRGAELKAWVKEWNDKHRDMKTSYPRVMEARKAYADSGVAGLLGQYGKSAGNTRINDDDFEYFKAAYLKEGGPSVRSCWIYTLGYAQTKEPGLLPEDYPTHTSFYRRLQKEVPEQSIFLARQGPSAWNRKYANYIDRDYSSVLAGNVWVSDHAQVDVAVMLPDGKVCFPWASVWRDFKTGKWLGWTLHAEAPNSDHVFDSFRISALAWGLPEHVYLDNGKDYRSKDFAGGRKHHKLEVNEKSATSMLGMLGIMPHFSLPYNGQSKPIERDFLVNKEFLSKHMVGYRGGNVVERPEILKEQIKKGQIISLSEFKKEFDDYVINGLNKLPGNGKNLKGRSRDQAWAQEFQFKRTVSADALALFCTRTSNTVTIGRNGVRDSQLQVTYWGEWMSGVKGEKVYIRRDINAYQDAWVFRAADDEFMGKASLADVVNALADTDIQKRELKEASASKKRDRKVAEAYAKTRGMPDTADKLAHLKLGVSALSGETPEASPKVNQLSNTRMDDVIDKERQMRATGTQDLTPFIRPSKGKRIYLFESDKD